MLLILRFNLCFEYFELFFLAFQSSVILAQHLFMCFLTLTCEIAVTVKLISLLWSVNLKKTEVYHHLLLNPYIMYPPLICVSMKHGAYITHNAPHPLNDITGGRLSDNMQ